jgi:NagD protein
MTDRGDIECWLTDMDGARPRKSTGARGIRSSAAVAGPGQAPISCLTNNSIFTPRDLSARLKASGLDVPGGPHLTSASLATADFPLRRYPEARPS